MVVAGLLPAAAAIWFLTTGEALWGAFLLALAALTIPFSMNYSAMRRRAEVWHRGEVPRPHVTEPIIWVEILLLALITAALVAIGVWARGVNDQVVEFGSFGAVAYLLLLLMLYLGGQVLVVIVRRREGTGA
jgi:hypothetical protein